MTQQDELTPPVGPQDHTRGPADAPATVVVYGDYQCPYTRRAWIAIKRVERRIGDRFQFVFRHFPLREFHPHAQGSAELAEAAADQGKFWEVHEHLFNHQDTLDESSLSAYAVQFGITGEGEDEGRFEAGHRYADRVEDQFQSGLRSGVDGTPAIFVNGRRHHGGYDESTLEQAIELAR